MYIKILNKDGKAYWDNKRRFKREPDFCYKEKELYVVTSFNNDRMDGSGRGIYFTHPFLLQFLNLRGGKEVYEVDPKGVIVELDWFGGFEEIYRSDKLKILRKLSKEEIVGIKRENKKILQDAVVKLNEEDSKFFTDNWNEESSYVKQSPYMGVDADVKMVEMEVDKVKEAANRIKMVPYGNVNICDFIEEWKREKELK